MKELLKKFEERPMSHSSMESFKWNPQEWYDKYILGKPTVETPEMLFGKAFAKSVEERKPLAPVTIYTKTEEPLKVVFSGITLIGFMDTYEPLQAFGDHKTGKKKWDQKRAQEHNQLRMYAFMLYITHKVPPEKLKIFLEWVPTQDNGDFTISFVKPIKVHHFDVKLTMNDITQFGMYLKEIRRQMIDFIKSK